MYLIDKFADDAGKKGGEFYTPTGVVKTLVRIMNPQKDFVICDPACGSGGLLIECVNYLKEKEIDAQNLILHGEEKNVNTWAISKMNMLFHNIFDSKIVHNDTMTDPILNEDGKLQLYDLVLANPMWNQKEWNRENFAKDGDRFGRILYDLPPANSADWMWIQHMIATLRPNGRMGVVLDNGVLFRGGSEGKIREAVVKADLIEGIISLPSNLFMNTTSPGTFLIINKQKSPELKNKIYFLYAENEFEPGKAQNHLGKDNIKKISSIYNEKQIIEKISNSIEVSEIKENGYNLNVSRYLNIAEEEEIIDVQQCLSELDEIRTNRKKNEDIFFGNMRELFND